MCLAPTLAPGRALTYTQPRKVQRIQLIKQQRAAHHTLDALLLLHYKHQAGADE